jgi:tetratricopeptide (TPR) repeat protein
MRDGWKIREKTSAKDDSMLRLLLALVILLMTFPRSYAAEVREIPPGGIRTPSDGEESWKVHRKLGDELAAKGDYRNAAANYRKVLSDAGPALATGERIRMATVLSWGGELEAAIRELGSILQTDPGNLQARIQLARSLSWAGKTGEAIREADRVLADSPGNPDALVVKGNALRFRNDHRSAILVFESVLAKKENFDARLGLSYACLAGGNIKCAKESARNLTPVYPYQEKERKNLYAEIDKAIRPALGAGYSYYRDSDDNRLDRYRLSTGFRTGAWRWGVGYLYTDAEDPTRNASDQELSLSADSRPTEWLGVGGTAGVNWTANDHSGTYFVGSVRADAKVLDGRIGAGVARNVFAETAQLIENGIRFTEIASFVEYPLPYRSTVRASYAFRDYTDDNRSDDWQGSIRHVFDLKNPLLAAGYRIRYLDFQRESGSGYFDPAGYLSHRVEFSVDYEKGRGYVHLAPFIGYQSYRRGGDTSETFFAGAEGVIGANISDSVALELHGEGSDEAGSSASGFRYYQAGVRMKARF